MLIDTHAHLNFNGYKGDFEEVIKRTLDNNVWVINVGSQYETSKKAVEIAEKYPEGIFAAIGLHPIHLETGLVKIKNDEEEVEVNTKEEVFDYEKYKELARSPKVVAIGEIGLDYYYRPKTKRKLELFKEKQKKALLKQLELAKELNLPVIFHCRMAHQDLLKVLKLKIKNEKLKIDGVIHCFTGSWEEAQEYLEMGFYLGFNGIIFKSIEGIDFKENIKKTPLDKILIETDCPYLAPPPFLNQRNEPLFVKYIAEKIAKIKDLGYEKISEITTENAKKLFNL
ncbi:MAG: hydrolase TatD [Candidatus Nealsonbacteria bacterium CG18_big_fil_WC_8_21_14_2_50_37_10]|uniref:Hydrolase TatD n=1 Tax=Candidatus Nealsonbacteria bacterium CG18_big_fil_WC_8_21_14_2_50_37_10 TaxID=1974717 RepID=A0A2H0FJD5_9BACT|nr:MAG: hydrolase TatD [Candidatus Nealsonbacteria bacterium CG18_big_fil_WC_8_21_14_2_50_37_10]